MGKKLSVFYKNFYICNVEFYLLPSSIIPSIFYHIPQYPLKSYIVRLLRNWWGPILNDWPCRLFPTVFYYKHFGDEQSSMYIVVYPCITTPGNTLQKYDCWVRSRPMFRLLIYTAKWLARKLEPIDMSCCIGCHIITYSPTLGIITFVNLIGQRLHLV